MSDCDTVIERDLVSGTEREVFRSIGPYTMNGDGTRVAHMSCGEEEAAIVVRDLHTSGTWHATVPAKYISPNGYLATWTAFAPGSNTRLLVWAQSGGRRVIDELEIPEEPGPIPWGRTVVSPDTDVARIGSTATAFYVAFGAEKPEEAAIEEYSRTYARIATRALRLSPTAILGGIGDALYVLAFDPDSTTYALFRVDARGDMVRLRTGIDSAVLVPLDASDDDS
jgi:hypothetical protein